MPRRAPSYTQADVTRLIKGALAAGVAMERIAVKGTKDGPVIMLGAPPSANSDEPNPWDQAIMRGLPK
jgi:hypothetical protein